MTDSTPLLGNIHSTESFGSVDGPGIRFIIFLRGCHMRCRYCHNPDTWSTVGNDLRSADELLDQAERYRPYWGITGGITVSGGEALLQLGFLTDLFRKAKQRGINTCLDTSAQPFTRNEPFFSKFRQLMSLTDLVLLDVKHIDSDAHKSLTRWDNDNILDCARFLSDINVPVWIRHVLVPGVTDDDASLHRLRTFIDTLTNVQKVEVLPYHTMGVYKWEQLGLHYSLHDVNPPTAESIANAERILCGKA